MPRLYKDLQIARIKTPLSRILPKNPSANLGPIQQATQTAQHPNFPKPLTQDVNPNP